MKYSVALCTYNGAKYIEKQIRSLLEQSVPVDEIIICDDGSKDRTVDIIRQIQLESKGICINLFQNSSNLGVCANFDKATKLCKGDIIFLADQDDIWMSNKVECISQYFYNHPEKNVVYTDGYRIDENDVLINGATIFAGFGMSDFTNRDLSQDDNFNLFCEMGRALGATIALRRSFIQKLQIDVTADPKNVRPLHDYIISMTAIFDNNSLGMIPECLINYRCHANQQCGLRLNYNKEKHRTPYDFTFLLSSPLLTNRKYKEKLSFITVRARNRSVLNSIKLLFYYNQYRNHYPDTWVNLMIYDLVTRHWNHFKRVAHL